MHICVCPAPTPHPHPQQHPHPHPHPLAPTLYPYSKVQGANRTQGLTGPSWATCWPHEFCYPGRAPYVPHPEPFSCRWKPREQKCFLVNLPTANPYSAFNPCQWNARIRTSGSLSMVFESNTLIIRYVGAIKLLTLVSRVMDIGVICVWIN